MSTHIEDLEKEEYEEKQRKYLANLRYNRSVKRTIAQTKEIWAELEDWLSDMTDHINSLRSTEWIPHSIRSSVVNHQADIVPCKVRGDEEHMCSSNVGIQWAYFGPIGSLYSYGGRNTVNDPTCSRSGVKRVPFLPFLEETLVFSIKTTKSASKRGEFDKFINNPPKGYVVIGTQLIEQRGGWIKLVIQLVLEKEYNFKSIHYRKYAMLRALKYLSNQIKEFTTWNGFFYSLLASELHSLSINSRQSGKANRILEHLQWFASNQQTLGEMQNVVKYFTYDVEKLRDNGGVLEVENGSHTLEPFNLISSFLERRNKGRVHNTPNALYWSENYASHNSYLHHCNMVKMDLKNIIGHKSLQSALKSWTDRPSFPLGCDHLEDLSESLLIIGSWHQIIEYLFSILSWDGKKETLNSNVLATFIGDFNEGSPSERIEKEDREICDHIY